jgi:hypothetical protein
MENRLKFIKSDKTIEEIDKLKVQEIVEYINDICREAISNHYVGEKINKLKPQIDNFM